MGNTGCSHQFPFQSFGEEDGKQQKRAGNQVDGERRLDLEGAGYISVP